MHDPIVLFVDDEPQILKAIKRVLRGRPYEALFAESGQQALAILESRPDHRPIQLIISDLKMPEMDGLTLLQHVQQSYPEIIRIVLSSVIDINPVLEAIHVGQVYRYITKPYDERELLSTIDQAVDTWRMQKDNRDLLAQLSEQNCQLEKRVKERTQQVLALERHAELGRYSSQIVHNLKTPLQLVTGFLEMARHGLENNELEREQLKNNLDQAHKGAKRLTRIISSILKRAKDPDRFESQWTSLNHVIKDSLQFFNGNDTFKYNIQKNIDLAAGLPQVWANPLHLQQIFDNLINNALDAMDNIEGQTLTIATQTENGSVQMTIADTGTGIGDANLPKIFDPDFSTKPPDKGTGLGLASVKTMVECYGGRIDVHPNRPRGTKFMVTLPRGCSVGK